MLDTVFGPDRHLKAVYRLRAGVRPLAHFSILAIEDGVLRGTINFWPVLIEQAGDADNNMPAVVGALLLGPLAVDPAQRGKGIGIGLMSYGLGLARGAGHRIVILVGDESYYSRVGFSRAQAKTLRLSGQDDLSRLLALEIVPGGLEGVTGAITRWPNYPVLP